MLNSQCRFEMLYLVDSLEKSANVWETITHLEAVMCHGFKLCVNLMRLVFWQKIINLHDDQKTCKHATTIISLTFVLQSTLNILSFRAVIFKHLNAKKTFFVNTKVFRLKQMHFEGYVLY